jgi:hypothetical protein
MSYTPPFSTFATVSIRRLAWALEAPMTSTVDRVVRRLPDLFNAEEVCRNCRDTSRCHDCAFRHARQLRAIREGLEDPVVVQLN